ncbi:MAG: transposase [Pirellulaceae bacterium]
MEQVLEVYKRPYDAKRPVVCMDEQPKQLIRESPIRFRSNREPQLVWTTNTFAKVLAMCGCSSNPWEVGASVRSAVLKAVDWANQVKALVDDPRYADVDRITLVCDNLNTHKFASLYQAFDAREAMLLVSKLELVHTPKHGSWLNVAESELSVLTRQCLGRRIAQQDEVADAATAWGERGTVDK